MAHSRADPGRSPTLAGDAAAAARGGASLLVLQTMSRGCGLAFVMLLTRHVDRAGVGRYSTVAALVVFANFLADFGTSPAITRSVSRERHEADRLLSGTLLPSLLFGVLIAAGVSAFASVAYHGATVVDVAIGSVAIPAASTLSSVLGALDGAGLIARRAMVSALQTVVVASGVVPVMAGTGIRGAIIALAVSSWIALVVAGTMARRAGLWRSGLRLDPAQIRRLLRAAVPFAVTGGLTALTLRFDVVLLSVTRTSSETAAYDLALRLLESVMYPATAICGPLLFILSRRIGRGDTGGAARVYGEATRIVYLIGLPLSAGLLLLARPIVSLVFGAAFGSVALPLAVMGAAQWLTFLVFLEGTLMLAGDAAGRGTIVLGLCAGVTVLLDIAFVPRYGPAGAAAVMVASWLLSVALLHGFNARTIAIRTPGPHASVVLATLALGAVLLGLRERSLALALPAGALVYVSVLVAMREFDGGDLRRLVGLARGSG